jgi:hypothetical protein
LSRPSDAEAGDHVLPRIGAARELQRSGRKIGQGLGRHRLTSCRSRTRRAVARRRPTGEVVEGARRGVDLIVVRAGREALELDDVRHVPWPSTRCTFPASTWALYGSALVILSPVSGSAADDPAGEHRAEVLKLILAGLPGVLREPDVCVFARRGSRSP